MEAPPELTRFGVYLRCALAPRDGVDARGRGVGRDDERGEDDPPAGVDGEGGFQASALGRERGPGVATADGGVTDGSSPERIQITPSQRTTAIASRATARDPRTVHRATTETSYLEVDFSLMLPFRYGVGLMLGGKTISPFGPNTTRAYGHLGFINIHVWADPARELSCALLTTGKPFLSIHLPPLLNLLHTISGSVPRAD